MSDLLPLARQRTGFGQDGCAPAVTRSDTRRPGIAAGDQTFADQDGVSAGAGVGEQVGGTAHAGLGDPDDVGRQAWGDPAEAQSRSTSGSSGRVR